MYGSSDILSLKKYIEVVRDIKSKNPDIKEFICLLQLDEEDLSQRYLWIHQKNLWKQFKNGYSETLVIIKTNFGKEFAFFIPHQF